MRMWGTAHNSSNPWRLFRCSTTRDNPGEVEQTTEQPRVRRLADDSDSSDQETDGVFYEQYDDNANANIIDKFTFYGWNKKSTCDKQTQTDMLVETSAKQEIAKRSPAKKVIYSKSYESLVKEPTVQPCCSRSFYHSYRTNKCQIDERQTTKNYDNRKMVLEKLKMPDDNFALERQARASVFPKGISMTDGFYGGKFYDSSPDEHAQYVSQNERRNEEYIEVSNRMKPTNTKQYSKEDFCPDLESDLRNMSCQDKEENNFKNQWSPFHQNRDSDTMFYDYRQPDEVSLMSERSCYSTTSGEEEGGYEIVDWSKYNDSYRKYENGAKHRSGAINSPLTTPVIDLSALDGYYTAPNSPDIAREQWQSYSEESCLWPYHDKDAILDYPHHYGATSGKLQTTEVIDTRHRVQSDRLPTNYQRTNGVHQENTLCCKCGKSTEVIEGQYERDNVEYKNKIHDYNNQHGQAKQEERTAKKDFKNLRLDTPPFISVQSLHYEADPETEKAKVVGRGSFGQVYKARFSDPMFNHLPIVIKEFDEEFTNTKEIIEEAKRLNYLQDTRYVPICYGLLCFGSPIQPKYGIVQEYVGTGLTLEQMLWDQYELPLEFWFRIAVQCCEGLARFHDKGILLNDIKTNNILIEFAEYSVRIRYIDFGLATDMRGKRYKNTRSLEDFVYLAPEVRKRGRTTTVASDIYSLGYILEQIKKYTEVNELTVIARLLMDRNPDARIPPREAASLLKNHMVKLGYDPMFLWEI